MPTFYDFVTIQEAAQRLGVSQDTVRRRIRKEELQAKQTPTPQGFRWVVELEGLEEDAQAAHTPPHRPGIGSTQVKDDTNDANDGALMELLREQLQEKDRQISELHRLLAQTALNAAPGRPWWKFWG